MMRELLEGTGIVDWLTQHLCDLRNPKLINYPLATLSAAIMRLAGTRLRAMSRRHRQVAIDIDGLPITVHGQQADSAYNGYAGERICLPWSPKPAICSALSCALAAARRGRRMDSGDRRRGPRARLDAGFTEGATLAALEAPSR